MKEDTRLEGPWVYGEEPKQGHRTDLVAFKAAIDAGATDKELSDSHFGEWLRYNKSVDKYRLHHLPARDWQTTVQVYYGATGTGKSRRARYEAGDKAYYLTNTGDNLWWDGYCGQENVVIDEFYGWIKEHDMLRILDRYPYTVQVGMARSSNVSSCYLISCAGEGWHGPICG